MKYDLKGKNILVTGGTGSFGKAFVKRIYANHPEVKRLVVYSRDELKQFEMSNEFDRNKFPGLRFFIGDIRDQNRFKRACEDIDVIIHAAALKQVPAAEYNPIEFIKTNIMGAENVIEAALDTGVERVVALSTDKAAAPINLYGATKLCSDKLFVAANNMVGKRDLRFSVVRYGNVMGSRGSVIPFFIKESKKGMLPITDPEMTRFNILLEEGVDQVMFALRNCWGGEILVPKISSYKITDLATAIAPDCEQKIVGIRPGEKIHEEMITESDAQNTVDVGSYYCILPDSLRWTHAQYMEAMNAKKVDRKFRYNSGENQKWLDVKELRNLIEAHLNVALP